MSDAYTADCYSHFVEEQPVRALCACGCGQPTRISTVNCRTDGRVAGQPMRFVKGHNARKPDIQSEYRAVMVNGKLRKIHRIRAEKALGKPLPPGVIVHHADGSRCESAPLVICQDRDYHTLLHVRMRVKAAGGNPDTDAMCLLCRRPKPFAAFAKDPSRRYGLNPSCRECQSAYQKQLKARRHAAV